MVRGRAVVALTPPYFPHTRGDGPKRRFSEQQRNPFSPHAWGWSALTFFAAHVIIIFPTRVGMVRIHPKHQRVCRHFPHTRGDGPSIVASSGLLSAFSPHAWGWSAVKQAYLLIGDIFPTRVGMVRIPIFLPRPRRYFPHTRGDGPQGGIMPMVGIEFSPHAWGWSAAVGRGRGSPRIFPTRVGMVRAVRLHGVAVFNFPHTRGDGPLCQLGNNISSQFSPHAWGWSLFTPLAIAEAIIFPTRVGMVRCSPRSG